MPYERPKLQTILERIKADLSSRFDTQVTILRRSVLDVLARACAGICHGLYGFINWVFKQLFPDTAETVYLERWASIWGIRRKGARAAEGAISLSGTAGSLLKDGAELQGPEGLRFITVDAQALDDQGALVSIRSTTAGARTNLPEGTALGLVDPALGIERQAVVLAPGLTGGSDAESDESLQGRLLARIQQPPHGGARHDYIQWALNQDAHGVPVTRAWLAEGEMGRGTLTVRFMSDDTTENGIPEDAAVQDVQAWMETQRPVTADLYVLAPRPKPVAFRIAGLIPATAQTQTAVVAELKDLIRREAIPGGTLLISHIREAISIAAREHDHRLVSPTANVETETGEILVFGSVIFEEEG